MTNEDRIFGKVNDETPHPTRILVEMRNEKDKLKRAHGDHRLSVLTKNCFGQNLVHKHIQLFPTY